MRSATTASLPSKSRAEGARNGINRGGRPALHGLSSARRALKALGSRDIDGRSSLGKTFARWRSDLVADLGGEAKISTQTGLIVDEVVRLQFLAGVVDAFLAERPAHVLNRRKKEVRKVVLDRVRISDSITRHLQTLGLDLRAKAPKHIEDWLEGLAPQATIESGDTDESDRIS